MKDNLLSLALQSQYSIKELIFINAASNYYVRLPIHLSAALFAANNEGKTSSLSALKLFLLPEINFKDSHAKFKFSSGGVAFRNEESFNYYFPSSESYIICEAENPRFPNGFCWILYRDLDLHYHRIAVPHPYSAIEHLFWNEDSTRNSGIGELHDDITIKRIKSKLLTTPFNGLLMTDRTEIAEAIYTRTSAKEDHTRFCLLPMVQRSSDASIDTVRALLNIAFNLGNAATDSLPKAIGAIIDSMNLSVVDEGGVFLDLDEKINEWRQLQLQQNHLSEIADNLPAWQQFKDNNQRYHLLKKEANSRFTELYHYIQSAQECFSSKHKIVSELLKTQEEEYNNAMTEKSKAEGEQIILRTKMEEAENTTKDLRTSLDSLQKLRQHMRSNYGIETPAGIIEKLTELIQNNQNLLQDDKNREAQLQTCITDLNGNQKKLLKIQQKLDQVSRSGGFLDQFEAHSSAVLYSINKNLALFTTQLPATYQAIVDDFADIFANTDNCLTLHGESLKEIPFIDYTNEKIIEELQDDLELLKIKNQRLTRLRDQLNAQSKLSPEQRALQNQKRMLDNQQYQDQITFLGAEAKMLQDLKTIEESLLILTENAEQTALKVVEMLHLVNEKKQLFSETQSNIKDIEDRIRSINLITRDIDQLPTEHRAYLKVDPSSYEEIKPLKAVDHYDHRYVEESRAFLSKSINNLISLKDKIEQQLKIFMDYGFIDATPEQKHRITLLGKDFALFYSGLETTFENLDKHRAKFTAQLQAHNDTVITSISLIKKTQDVIDQFKNRLNNKLAEYKVSNLDQVEVDFKFNPQFTTALNAMNSIKTTYDNTLPEALYDNISSFQSHCYDSKSCKINIAKIIQTVKYRFIRDESRESIPQSNGTNSMVNAILLSVLFKEMIPEDLSLSLPVVFDEIGSLDSNNLNEIYKAVTAQDLVLFAVLPTNSGTIASVLDIFHDLSTFQVIDTPMHGKAKSIYFQGMEETLFDLLNEEADADAN